MKLRSAFLAAGALATFAGPQQLSAQTAGDGDTGAGAGLEEVIVTARRREEALQDVPISVSALSGEALERAGISDIQALQYQTPSLAITSTFSQRNVTAFALRGQRTQETQLFTDPPVGTYFAEVVQPRPYGFGNALYDLQSVQVLKGVQGTLFGRNMTGGAVLVEPRHPTLDETSGEVRGTYGNHETMEFYGVANVPLGESFAVRVAGKVREREGWAREVTTGRDYDNQNYDTARVSALFQPSDTFNSLTIADWYRSREHGTAAFLTSVVLPSALSNYENLRNFGVITTNIPAEFAAAQALFRQRRYSLDLGAGEGGNLDAFGMPYEDVENYGVTNKTTWELSDSLRIKNIAGYRRNTRDTVQDFDGIPAFLITPNQFARVSNYSEELQLQGEAFEERLDFIFGAFYFKEEGIDGSNANTLPQLTFAGAGVPQTTSAALFQISNPGEGSSTTYAGFAAGTYHFTDQFSASGGVRYNYDKREITVSPQRPLLNSCQWDLNLVAPGVQSVPIDQCRFSNEKDFDEITYDATLQYEPNQNVTVYGSFRHGFRAGGFSTRAQNEIALRPFLPELVDEYELGLKTNTPLGGGQLTSSLAVFRQDGTDVQKQRSASFDTTGDGIPDTVVTIVDNTAEQRNTGGEFELGWNAGDFGLTGFYSYTKIEILEGGAISAIGQREIAQRGTPKHQAGLTGTLDMPVGDLGEIGLTANVTWRSENFLDDFELNSRQPSYTLVNLRAEWSQIAHSGLSVAAYATNLTDEEYRIGVLGLIGEGLGFQSSVYGEPRMYGVEIGYKF
jgi:iron complex outermembrane recepter protein